MKNKAKFCRLDVSTVYECGGKPRAHGWTEWFCLDEMWTNPYNRGGHDGTPRAKAFRLWCEKAWNGEGNESVCPDVKIKGADGPSSRLNDGWGSDVTGRICSIFCERLNEAEGDLCDAIEKALAGGEVQTFSFKGEGFADLRVKITPFENVEIDPESVRKFGPFAEDALQGLVPDPKAWMAEANMPAEDEYNRAMNTQENLNAIIEAGYRAILEKASELGMAWNDTDGGIVFDTPDGKAKIVDIIMKDE